jgi:hypothetical protein
MTDSVVFQLAEKYGGRFKHTPMTRTHTRTGIMGSSSEMTNIKINGQKITVVCIQYMTQSPDFMVSVWSKKEIENAYIFARSKSGQLIRRIFGQNLIDRRFQFSSDEFKQKILNETKLKSELIQTAFTMRTDRTFDDPRLLFSFEDSVLSLETCEANIDFALRISNCVGISKKSTNDLLDQF